MSTINALFYQKKIFFKIVLLFYQAITYQAMLWPLKGEMSVLIFLPLNTLAAGIFLQLGFESVTAAPNSSAQPTDIHWRAHGIELICHDKRVRC
jgi:hypothetical protein